MYSTIWPSVLMDFQRTLMEQKAPSYTEEYRLDDGSGRMVMTGSLVLQAGAYIPQMQRVEINGEMVWQYSL